MVTTHCPLEYNKHIDWASKVLYQATFNFYLFYVPRNNWGILPHFLILELWFSFTFNKITESYKTIAVTQPTPL